MALKIEDLFRCENGELIMMVVVRDEKIEKLEREIFGMKQTIANLKEKDEKAYAHISGSCNYDTDYVNKYHSKMDK